MNSLDFAIDMTVIIYSRHCSDFSVADVFRVRLLINIFDVSKPVIQLKYIEIRR